MMNRVMIQGRLTSDPIQRYTRDNTPVTAFTLACDRDRKTKDGERKTDFIDMNAWGGTAEFVTRNFKKGQMALVDGRLEVQKFVDKDGNNRAKSVVKVDNIYFCDSKKPDHQGGQGQQIPPPVNGYEGYDNFQDLGEEGDGDTLPF